jgi:hypothetical protein
MASQRVLLVAIGGDLATAIWQDICRWNDARATEAEDEWAPEDWSLDIRREVDRFVAKMHRSAFTPPVLYRAEYVDTWSMGDVFETALVKKHRDYSRRLYTNDHEIVATWVGHSEHIIPDDEATDETRWLYNRVNEAMDAWSDFAERRLLVLVRSGLGGLWADDEVKCALQGVPEWFAETEPPDAREARLRSG